MSLVLQKKENTFGATMLVTGCCIGAGMIGLPILSLMAGFFPSLLAMFFSYLFTTCTGLLLLESALWFRKKTNLLSMAQLSLGKWGRISVGVLFLFLFYSIFIAYMDGGGQLFNIFFNKIFRLHFPRELGVLTCAVFVGLAVCAKMKIIDQMNRGFLIGLCAAYFGMVWLCLPYIERDNLLHFNWKSSLSTLPILFICFGYQNLVPTLVDYLGRNVNSLRFAIVIGNFIPFFFYALWNFVILGMLSPANSYQSDMVATLLSQTHQSPLILFASQIFSFFALITSFIAVAISFLDFFRDGLKERLDVTKRDGEFLIFGLVFLPPFVFSLIYPSLFLKALEFAGGIVDVILFGIFPVLIVWSGRYYHKIEGPYKVAGGKILLAVIFALSFSLLIFQKFL